jgi:hypothetical protein
VRNTNKCEVRVYGHHFFTEELLQQVLLSEGGCAGVNDELHGLKRVEVRGFTGSLGKGSDFKQV